MSEKIMANKKNAIVIVPTYNERENIDSLLTVLFDTFKTVANWYCQVLIVDDTSPDKTYELVKKLQQKYSDLHLLLNKTKVGLGGAYLRGMDYAFSSLKADVVIEFDADLS